jgi:hypothetical protein
MTELTGNVEVVDVVVATPEIRQNVVEDDSHFVQVRFDSAGTKLHLVTNILLQSKERTWQLVNVRIHHWRYSRRAINVDIGNWRSRD